MSANVAIFYLMVLMVWALCALLVATVGENRRNSVLYPGKMDGEKGIMTTLRWSFLFAFAPLITVLFMVYVVWTFGRELAKHTPSGLKKMYEWMKEEG